MKAFLTMLIPLIVATCPAIAQQGDFLTAEYETLGAQSSSLWRIQEIGGSRSGDDEIGGAAVDDHSRSYSNVGTKLKAGFLSLLVPGLGQLYNGDRQRALIFGVSEAAVWTSYFVLHTMAHSAQDDYIEYAGIFAGTTGEHADNYWRTVGRYTSSEDYNLVLIREARYEGVEPTGLISGADAWSWNNEEFRSNYQDLRADANRTYDRRDFTILFAIVNRAIATYDAVRNAGGGHMAEVAGLGFDLEPRRVLGRAGTACVISRRF